MEIVKTYDLEKLKEIVSKEISVGLSSGRDHARINLISAQEISEILAECMVREERLKRMFENIIKESDKNVCALDENLSPVFVEKEHPETEMIEGEIKYYIRIIEDKEREINDHHKHLDYMKESLAMKDEQIKCLLERNEELEKEVKELKEKNKMFYESITEGVKITKPSCFGTLEEECVESGKCLYLGECIDETQNKMREQTNV